MASPPDPQASDKTSPLSPAQQRWATTFRQEIVRTLDDQMAQLLGSLPQAYFDRLPEADQLAHLKALMAFEICDINQEIMLRGPDGRQITFISRENYPGLLARLIRRLPRSGNLVGAQIFTSRDRSFIVDMFEFQPEGDAPSPQSATAPSHPELVAQVASLTAGNAERIAEFVAQYHPDNAILGIPEEVAGRYPMGPFKTRGFNSLCHHRRSSIRTH